MQRFTTAERVSASEAIHDRIELKFIDCFVNDPDARNIPAHSLVVFLNYLATPPELIRDELRSNRNARRSETAQHTTGAAAHGMIFTRAGGTRADFRKLDVRKSPSLLRDNAGEIPRPLFAGRLRANVTSLQSLISIRLTADLKLNPTHYVRHSLPRGRRRQVLAPFADVFEREESPDTGTEQSLDGRDNWIPLTEANAYPRTASEIAALRQQYFLSVHSRYAYEIETAARRCRFEVQPSPLAYRGQLGVCESYWEFLHDEPIRLVEAMEPIVLRFCAYVEAHKFVRENIVNSVMLRCTVRKGVILRIYSKTNRRIRIEVEHDLSSCNVPVEGEIAFQSLADLEAGLETMREDSARIVNQFLEMADEPSAHNATQLSPAALWLRVLGATRDDAEQAEQILQLFCTTGRIVANKLNPLTPAIKQLGRWGFVRNRARSNVYYPSAACRYAVQVLAEIGRLPMLFHNPAALERRRARGT